MSNDLAQRAVACRHWRWMPGMVWYRPSSALGPIRGRMIGDDPSGLLLSEGWPDLTDPATLGCLLALVREAGAYIRHLSMLPMGCTVNVEWPDGRICDYRRETLAEALVAALEAAP
jgi:hypothetical protein